MEVCVDLSYKHIVMLKTCLIPVMISTFPKYIIKCKIQTQYDGDSRGYSHLGELSRSHDVGDKPLQIMMGLFLGHLTGLTVI